MLLLYVRFKTVRYRVESIFGYSANEAVRLHILFYAIQLITEFTKCVDDQT